MGSHSIVVCVNADAGGEPLGDDAYMRALPFSTCFSSHAPLAIASLLIGLFGAIFHAIIVPAGILWLFKKQQRAIKPARQKSVFVHAEVGTNEVTLFVSCIQNVTQKVSGSWSFCDGSTTWLASSAYVISAGLQLECTKVIISSTSENVVSLCLPGDYDVNEINGVIRHGKELAMCALEQARLDEVALEDDVVNGTLETFKKYRVSEFVAVEILLRVVNVLLVVLSTQRAEVDAGNKSTFAFSCICAAVAFGFWAGHPFVNEHHNNLWSVSYLCLSFAGVAFNMIDDTGSLKSMVGRCILNLCYVLPFALFTFQLRKPEQSSDHLKKRILADIKYGDLRRGEPIEFIFAEDQDGQS
eukprot:gnl/MRDRNA2_/MRDRNA2_84796_c0_seq1.p1 gnl/MRDRNA2_/MRDRNA2_84796_c0~~gnl/MRDRNA2_/MRDRNA2_84796_c0_seq1.p1  ORF type:complete len:384 (-),score=55.17 gnl/MRDRNA2_/MRDRNA2_84796_c0_seq1:288-1355(-)